MHYSEVDYKGENYLDWMQVGDQKTWQGQHGGCMDIDYIQQCQPLQKPLQQHIMRTMQIG